MRFQEPDEAAPRPVVFERHWPPRGGWGAAFPRVKPAPRAAGAGALAALITASPPTRTAPSRRADPDAATPAGDRIRVLVPREAGRYEALHVAAPAAPDASVGEFVQQVLAHCGRFFRAETFALRMADGDAPDWDIPPFPDSRTFAEACSTAGGTFALVAGDAAGDGGQASSAEVGNGLPFALGNLAPFSGKRARIAVRVPAGTGGVVAKDAEVHVLVDAAEDPHDILEAVCRVRGVPWASAMRLAVCYVGPGASAVPMELTAGELVEFRQPMTLGARPHGWGRSAPRAGRGATGSFAGGGGNNKALRSGNADRDLLLAQMDEMKVAAYVEYDVVKLNRHGTRQPRVLAVDRDRVYNLPPRKLVSHDALSSGASDYDSGAPGADRRPSLLSLSTSRGEERTKKRARLVRDIVEVGAVPGRPRMLRIAYRNDTSGTAAGGLDAAAYEFELTKESECAELVARLQFLKLISAQEATATA